MDAPDYRDLEKQSVGQYFDELLRKFETFEWFMPRGQGYPLETRENREDVLTYLLESPNRDPTALLKARNEVNEFRAMQKLYFDHGWPDAFDGQAWERARDDFIQRDEQLKRDARERVSTRQGESSAHLRSMVEANHSAQMNYFAQMNRPLPVDQLPYVDANKLWRDLQQESEQEAELAREGFLQQMAGDNAVRMD